MKFVSGVRGNPYHSRQLYHEIVMLSVPPISLSLITPSHIPTNDPIPMGKLDPHILAEFEPLIRAEAAKEFALQDDARARRNTREYGFSFFKMVNGDFSYSPPPEFFQRLGAHICQALGHEPVEFTNIIFSVYEKGFHLNPHVDVNKKDLRGTAPFYFGERVYGLVIEPDPTGHLYFAKWEGKEWSPPVDIEPVYSIDEKAGTVFCLEGDFRRSPYFHAVSPVSNKRISLTFRTVERI